MLTHRRAPRAVPGVTFVDDLTQGVEAAAGGKYVNVLGADVARQCLASGVLDEVLVLIAPVLLGDGVRLFDHPGGTRIGIERLADRTGATSLWFRVVN